MRQHAGSLLTDAGHAVSSAGRSALTAHPSSDTLQPERHGGRTDRPSSAPPSGPRSNSHHGRHLRIPHNIGALPGPPRPCQAPGRAHERTTAPLPLPRAAAHPGLDSGRGRAGHQFPGAPSSAPGAPKVPPPPCVPAACLPPPAGRACIADTLPQPPPPLPAGQAAGSGARADHGAGACWPGAPAALPGLCRSAAVQAHPDAAPTYTRSLKPNCCRCSCC